MGNAALVAVAGGFIGALLGNIWWGVSIALALALARHLYYFAALRAWVDQPRRTELPEATGTWRKVYAELVNLQRRNRKRKKRLAAMLAQFQSSAQALPDGVVFLEPSGEIAWFNAVARSLLGLSNRHDIGQRIVNLLRHPEFTAYFDGGDYEDEIEIPSPENRNVMLSVRIIPYGVDQRLLLVRDVSNLYRLERIRRDFVANASHELRTPLTVLRGYIEMMRPETREGGSLEEWKAPLAEMHGQATRMEALLRDLLKLARLEAEGSQERADNVSMAEVIERVVGKARETSGGAHDFKLEVDRGLYLFGRATDAESVVGNLVTNAVQYSPDGGQITVRWKGAAGGARFEVEDQGIGLAPDDIPRLTERFYRVDEARSQASGGTGLGLSIVKHVLEGHEGRLEIRSELGKGSTFSCSFPRHRVNRHQDMAASA